MTNKYQEKLKYYTEENPYVLAPKQCECVRPPTFWERIKENIFGEYLHYGRHPRRCQRYHDHEKFNYKHSDSYGKEW